MKRLAMLGIGFTLSFSSGNPMGLSLDISSGTPLIINLQDSAQFQMIPTTVTICPTISTTPVPCVQTPPVVSTGPFILKAGSGDCYRAEGINPNGTMLKSPLDWVVCP